MKGSTVTLPGSITSTLWGYGGRYERALVVIWTVPDERRGKIVFGGGGGRSHPPALADGLISPMANASITMKRVMNQTMNSECDEYGQPQLRLCGK